MDKIDLKWRPKTYWPESESREQRLSHIKGEVRRNIIREALEVGGVQELNKIGPQIASDNLSECERQAWGSFHPRMMGGEYLPDPCPNEVEIARITLDSTTMDVIAIMARKTKHRIKYRIVDEYPEDGFDYKLTHKSSIKPLTFGQLISLIDNAQEHGLTGNAREWNYSEGGGGPEEIYDFATASSGYYSGLTDWYDMANQEWLENELNDIYRDRLFDEEEAADEREKEWRKNNFHKFADELQEHLQEQLYIEYKSRYLNDLPSKSKLESDWRLQNEMILKEELHFQRSVEACLQTAEWSKPGGAMAAWGNCIKRSKIRKYIENYINQYGNAPTGSHDTDGFNVTFITQDK